MAETGPVEDAISKIKEWSFEVNAYNVGFQCPAPDQTWDVLGHIYLTNGKKIHDEPEAQMYFYADKWAEPEARDNDPIQYYIRRFDSMFESVASALETDRKVTAYARQLGKWVWTGVWVNDAAVERGDAEQEILRDDYDPTRELRPRIIANSFEVRLSDDAAPGNGARSPMIVLHHKAPGHTEKGYIYFHQQPKTWHPESSAPKDICLNFPISLFGPIRRFLERTLSATSSKHTVSVYEKSGRPSGAIGLEQVYRGLSMSGLFSRRRT